MLGAIAGPRKHRDSRTEVLEGAPFRLAPENEQGVVFLFAHLAKRWRVRVEEIKQGFPDCIGYQKVRGREERVRIEFEFKSKNFQTHGHPVRGCDWIVCWEHNWPGAPKSLRIVEPRRDYGLGFNVWIVSVKNHYKEDLAESRTSDHWSVPSQAHRDDLTLFYSARPQMSIEYVYTMNDHAARMTARWKKGSDYMAPIRRVCRLKAPIFLEDLRRHRILSTAPFVRSQMQGRPNATEYWPHLYEMIIKRYPATRRALSRYAPDRLD